jgi:hypothetical protein
MQAEHLLGCADWAHEVVLHTLPFLADALSVDAHMKIAQSTSVVATVKRFIASLPMQSSNSACAGLLLTNDKLVGR